MVWVAVLPFTFVRWKLCCVQSFQLLNAACVMLLQMIYAQATQEVRAGLCLVP